MSTPVELAGIRDRMTIAVLGGYWRDQRFEYSSSNIVYKGVHELHNAATTDTGWQVWKYTWTGDDLTRVEGPLSGAWDSRASLDWA